MSVTMLADAVFSEAYRFTKNRMTVFWSVIFLPIALLLLSIVGQMFLKQKMVQIGNDPRLPPGLLGGGTLDLGHGLVKLAGDMANPMLLLFVLIGTATLYAGDYRWETWRLTSARNTRTNLILGKVGVAKVLTLTALIVFLAFGFVGEIAKGMIHSQSYVFHFGGTEAKQFGLLALTGYVRVVQVGLLGLLAAVVTRSLLATLFVPLVVSIAQFFLMQSMPLFGWEGTEWYAQAVIPGLAYDNIKSAVLGGMMSAVPDATVWAAAISLLGWCVVSLALAVLWFQRQDLSKE
jgi:ABC-2 type transport system permease protein